MSDRRTTIHFELLDITWEEAYELLRKLVHEGYKAGITVPQR